MKRILFFFAFALRLFSQPQNALAPDCSFSANFTATGHSASYDNRAQLSPNAHIPCVYWSLSYSADSTVTAVTTINIEAAPGNGSTPGTFASLASSSTLPSARVDTAGANGYYPWLNITVSAYNGTGQIRATLNGWRANAGSISAASSAGCAGTTATPCVVDGPTAVGSAPINAPVQTSAVDSAGNVVRFQNCTLQAQFDTSSSGNTLLVAASGATQIRVCRLSIEDATGVAGASPTNTEQLVQGTGATCAGGTTNLWMAYVKVFAAAEDFPLGPLIASASNAVCIDLTNATRVTGAIQYAQY